MIKKQAIPRVAPSDNPAQAKFNQAVKENLEILMGQRGDKIKPIDTAGMAGNDLVLANKINEILDRLQ